jgi:histidine triad (HIT) family protein
LRIKCLKIDSEEKNANMSECIFCRIIKGEIETNIIYEDNDIMSFLDIDPINVGHILIVPKKHLLDIDEMSNDLLTTIMLHSKTIARALKDVYNPDGYSIMQNGGIFNEIGHYHLHIFPRYSNDGFSWNCRDIKSDLKIEANKIIKILKNY